MKKLLYSFFICASSLSFANQAWLDFKQKFFQKEQKFYFWTTPQKASHIMDFIFALKPQTVVEVGTFQGSMTFAMASALQFLQKGMLHTVDTWSYYPDPSKLDSYNLFANFWYTQEWDGDKIYSDFLASHFQNGLRAFCHPIRLDSSKAASLFADDSIDMLYLDGDLREDTGIVEILCFLGKVRQGGAIWINRADLESKHEIIDYLMTTCRYEPNWSYGNECVLFIKT